MLEEWLAAHAARTRRALEDEETRLPARTDARAVGAEVWKYFKTRYALFSKYDEGVATDLTGWYSVTPENVAKHVAARAAAYGATRVIDLCAGVGGNTIQFALSGFKTIAVETDAVRLKCLMHNLKVYRANTDLVVPILMDANEFARAYANLAQHDVKSETLVVHVSPPWGGPEYLSCAEYTLNMLENEFPVWPELMHNAARIVGSKGGIMVYLPRTLASSCLRKLHAQLLLPSSANKEKSALLVEELYTYHRLRAILACSYSAERLIN